MLTVHDHNQPNSIQISLPKDVRAILKRDEVVIVEQNNELHIREAMIDDIKTLKINTSNCIIFSSESAKNFIGKCNWEFDESSESIVVYK